MDADSEYFLRVALKRLDEAALKTIQTSNYGEESERLRILQEIVKEQLANEDTNSPAGETR